MFEEFAKKKFNDYIKLFDFVKDRTTFQKIRVSNLPPYIINFFECSYKTGQLILQKKEAEEILNKALVFNINYVIKPKSTLLKFLFGQLDTKPAEYIQERLRFFQFYSYYINTITEFISLNTPLIISIEQVKHLIDEVNKNILSEISDVSEGDSQRLNLIKLLYYFFLDLTKNNPINIKLPKKILSLFFQDKGFTDIKNRIDKFFSDEIFIQEAVELMKPPSKTEVKAPTKSIHEEKVVEEFLKRAKKELIDESSSEKDIEKAVKKSDEDNNITEFREAEESDIINRIIEDKHFIKENLHSEDLLLVSRNKGITAEEPITEEQKSVELLNKLFCEESYRRKIIKRVFHRDEKLFNNTVLHMLGVSDWKNVITLIEEYFDTNRINYFSEEAVKFVDILQNYYSDSDNNTIKKQG